MSQQGPSGIASVNIHEKTVVMNNGRTFDLEMVLSGRTELSKSMQEHCLGRVNARGYGYSPQLGIYGPERFNNCSALSEFGVDIMSEAFGNPAEDTESDSVEPVQKIGNDASLVEVFKGVYFEFSKLPGICYDSFKKINWVGPLRVPQEEDEGRGLNFR